MSDLIVISYKDGAAYKALDMLENMQKMELIELADAAVAEKDAKGKVKIKQTLEKQVTGASAVWGGFWGLLIGLIFLAPLLGGLLGLLMGAIFGKATDVGIDNKFIKQVGASLQPGGSALFMLVVKATTDKVLPELASLGGEVYQTSLSNEDEAKLREALKDDEVKDHAHDNLDMDDSDSKSGSDDDKSDDKSSDKPAAKSTEKSK